ncbi:MAG: hypothetical protein JSR26_04095 [Proteobacteria bacterium]|nr:hypothetical protein [Pseudomonadota bacterium]
MPHVRTGMQRYMEFALWASRQRRVPSVHQVAGYFGIHIGSARRIRNQFLAARGHVAADTAHACAARIEARDETPSTTALHKE